MSEATLESFDKLWNYQDPAATEVAFRALLDSAPADAPPALLAELRTQIARTFSLRRQFEQAHAELDTVEAQLDALAADRVRVRYLLERGRAFRSAGELDRARPLFEQAFDLAGRAHLDALAVDAAHMVALAVPAAEAITWNERALAAASASSEPAARNWRGSLLNNLGWTHFEEGRHERALELFVEAAAFRREMGQLRERRIADWCVAKAQRVLGRTEEALETQLALHNEYEDSGEVSGYVFEEVGECLTALDRAGEAVRWFALAHRELAKDSWLAENEAERLARIARLGNVEAEPADAE